MRLFLAFVVTLSLSAPAAAEDRAAAREHFLKGTKFFDLGKFDEAIAEYEAAYQIKDDPVLLYNLGQAHRLANHVQQAVHFYRAYLSKVPRAPNREEVLLKIEELNRLLEQQARAKNLPPDAPLSSVGSAKPNATPETPPPTPAPTHASVTPPPVEPPPTPAPTPTPAPAPEATPTPAPAAQPTPAPTPAPVAATTPDVSSEHPGRNKKIAGGVIMAVGAAFLVGGIASAALVSSNSDAVSQEAKNHQPFDPSQEDSAHSRAIAGGVLLGIGGAALVAGTVVLVLGVRDSRRVQQASATLIPIVGPQAAGATLRLAF
jgi:outer membrane biosynthesis protein TonB